jgi:hypothetical protein
MANRKTWMKILSVVVKIYDGLLFAKGLVNIRFGYVLEDGTIVQSARGIALTTTN